MGLCSYHMLFSEPKTSISIQKCHPYTGNLASKMLGDSKDAFLHWGDVSMSVLLSTKSVSGMLSMSTEGVIYVY